MEHNSMLKGLNRILSRNMGYRIVREGTQTGENTDTGLEAYKDLHESERCVIIGNGPSLLETDLSLLESETTFGLNKVYLLFPRISWEPTYVVSYVPDVVRQAKEELNKLKMPLFLSKEGRELLGPRQGETYHFGPIKRFLFSMKPHKEICVGHTVTYVTLQLAFYMGFSQVILIGVDHSFGYEGPPDKWHVIDEPSKGRHFDENYFAPGQTWQAPNLKMAEAHYRLARDVYDFFDRKIVDCTVNGKLQVFRKSTLEETL
jgi:hypothetical protein